MISTKLNTFLVVIALLFFTGFVSTGCGKKTEGAMVNTASLPGHTFAAPANSQSKPRNPSIVYLGSESSSSSSNFGPRDPSFGF